MMLSKVRDIVLRHYEAAPSPVQDLLCSAYGLQEMMTRRGSHEEAETRLAQIDAWHRGRPLEPESIESRLQRILGLARQLPAYRALAPTPSPSPRDELKRWPVLTKSEVLRDPRAFLTRPIRESDIVTRSSGTTGTPMEIWRTPATTRELYRSIELFRRWHGARPNGRRASFTGKMAVPLSSDRVWRINAPGRQIVLSQYHLSQAGAADYERVLRWWRPEVMDGYTSNLVDLARHMKASGLRVPIPVVVTTCEVLTPEGRRVLEEVFGCRVGDQYGSSEHIALAAECVAGRRHIFENLGLIEVTDEEGAPVPDGVIGNLLLTTVTNDLMPLIRYAVGDRGSLDRSASCPCGRVSPVLATVEGRADDNIITADGRTIAIFTFNLLRGAQGVVQMQVVQRSFHDFIVRVVLDETRTDREAFEAFMADRFRRLLGEDPDRKVKYEFESRIERTPGGKIRNVIREFTP